MLTDQELIELEKKYFNIIADVLSRNLGSLLTQINNQKLLSSSPVGAKINKIEHAIENIIEGIINTHLKWHVSSMVISSDSCFEVGDAIIHLDSKTVSSLDNDARNNKINIEKSTNIL